MSKNLLSKAERWAALYAIPEEIRPSTIKHSIMLPNIVAITFEYRKGAKDIGPAFRFLRKYGADIRFHNPELKLQRLKTPEGPISLKVSIYKRQNPEPIVLYPTTFKNYDEMKSKLLYINNEL